jgi:hypothetical protein
MTWWQWALWTVAVANVAYVLLVVGHLIWFCVGEWRMAHGKRG